MDLTNSQKISKFKKIKMKFNVFCDKIALKYRNSQDFQSGVDLVGDIILCGILAGLTLFVFSPILLLKMLGFGCGIVLIKTQIIPNIIIPILNSFRLVATK